MKEPLIPKKNLQRYLSVDESLDDFEKVEGELRPLEAASLACVLDICALQLHVLDSGTTIPPSNYSVILTR